MALSNRDRVGRALEALAEGLGPFVDEHMAAFLPAGRDWLRVMQERAERQGKPATLSRSDTRVLLRAIVENMAAFRRPLSKLDVTYAREIIEVANQWAHLESFSDADTTRTLDTIARLLRAAGAEANAADVLDLGADARTDKAPDPVPVIRPYGYRPVAPDDSASHTAVPGDGIVEFRDSDDAYLAWIAAHGSGYVVNIGRSGRGPAAFHRATCGTITNRPPFTRTYMKVCSESLTALDRWALQRNGVVAPRCGTCLRSAATGGNVSQRWPSKYDALRSLLAENGKTPVTLTFAEIDHLIGGLPRSAWLYHLWWRNDDPSHHHCRSWGDAGYTATPDFAEQRVTFTPKFV